MLSILPKAAPQGPSLPLVSGKWEQGLFIQAPDTASSQTPKKPDRLLKKRPSFSCHPQAGFPGLPLLAVLETVAVGRWGGKSRKLLRVSLLLDFPRPLHVLGLPPPPLPI